MTAYQGRRYVFAIHGRSQYLRRRLQRCRPERSGPAAENPAFQTMSLHDVANHERLIEAYDELRRGGGTAPGVDGLTFVNLGRSEVANVLRGVWRAIHEGTYRPQPPRRVRVPKRGGGHRVLRLRTIFDRAVGKALARALTPLLDRIFGPRIFGFRPQRSHLEMLAAIEAEMMRSNRWVLAVDDIRRAFDTVPIAEAVSKYRNLLGDPALVTLIEAVLRGYQGQRRIRGIDQGCPFSPLTLNVFLNDILDRPLRAHRELPPLYRYADNLAFECGGVPEGERALQRAQAALQAHGLELKQQDGPPVDLRQPRAGINLLGFRITRRNDRLRFELENEAWQDLMDAMEQAHLSSRPGQTARSIVRGWVWGHAAAFETDAETATLRSLRSTLARTGLLDEVTDGVAQEVMRQAHAQWELLRSRAQEVPLIDSGSDLLLTRCAPRAGDDPVFSQENTEADDSAPF
jgi:RNA-directed DNA polymerase